MGTCSPQSGNEKQIGGVAKLSSSKAQPQLFTSFSKAPCTKGPTTFRTSTPKWVPGVQTHEPLGTFYSGTMPAMVLFQVIHAHCGHQVWSPVRTSDRVPGHSQSQLGGAGICPCLTHVSLYPKPELSTWLGLNQGSYPHFFPAVCSTV